VKRIAVLMPALGFDQATGRVAGWLREVGDPIRRGDTIAEIETEKVTVGLEAMTSGTLIEIVAGPGDEVAVGQPIAWLDDSG
jgi:pyruvate dehydrogenase E2 component (dihydrolipoyllysine-residue acetyltransferase)